MVNICIKRLAHEVSKVFSVHAVSNRFKKSKCSFKMWGIKERDDSRIICSIPEILLV